MTRQHFVVGTAGHIDHGKSTLVQALTGTDPDRWEEEKRRGITIDLGFAHLEVGEAEFAFVDVPGHERFVHNMLAGATGIDLVMLVIAADESVMPQTREHLAICDLLGVRAGLVALTRMDLVEEDLADLVEEELEEVAEGTFLEGAPVVRVSGKTGRGLEELKGKLVEVAQGGEGAGEGPWARLPIDRVFAAKGFGTVVTGTLQGGTFDVGQELVSVLGAKSARVRGLQVHGRQVERAEPHRRVAVNLQGIDRDELSRGDVLVAPGLDVCTRVIDAWVRVLPDAPCVLEEGQRVHVHHGTASVLARLRLPDPGTLEPGSEGACQLRLEDPLALLPGDRFIVRRYSPLVTLAGGVVADLAPPRWRRNSQRWPERTRALASADAQGRVRLAATEAGPAGLALVDDAKLLGVDPGTLRSWIEEGAFSKPRAEALCLLAGERVVGEAGLERLLKRVRSRLAAFHKENPLEDGMSPQRLRQELVPEWGAEAFREVLEDPAGRKVAHYEARVVCLPSHRVSFSEEDLVKLQTLESVLEGVGLEALDTKELLERAGLDERSRELLVLAGRKGRVIRVKQELWLGLPAWRDMVDRLRQLLDQGTDSLDVPTFKDLFGVSRKYAIPLLERLDDGGITRRAGNIRVIQRP